MTRRRWLFLAASLLLGAGLVFFLVRLGHIDFEALLHQVRSVSLMAFLSLVALTSALSWISTVKWRSIDACLRRSMDSSPSRTEAFMVSATGMALGTILPVQFGMTAARTLGTQMHGRALTRGTAATLFEQSFDFLAALLISAATELTLVCKETFLFWLAASLIAVGLGIAVAGPVCMWLGRTSAPFQPPARSSSGLTARLIRGLAELQRSGLLSARLARRLLLLSTLRFAILALVAIQTASAIGAHIPSWHLAAALPFVTVACAIAITPGSLGINEFSFAVVLHLFGTPLGVAAAWAIANRLLVTAACFVVPLCIAPAFWLQRLVPSVRVHLRRS
ncbi:MAG: lysylphosphatidylglycerol synthase transmembrane domain-containing protein [Acidobacteriaceae bacterium]